MLYYIIQYQYNFKTLNILLYDQKYVKINPLDDIFLFIIIHYFKNR